MVLFICTKNELNLTNRYWDMVPDGQKVGTDGRTEGGTDARTMPKLYPSDFVGGKSEDKKGVSPTANTDLTYHR